MGQSLSTPDLEGGWTGIAIQDCRESARGGGRRKFSRISNGHQVQGSASLPRWPSTKPIYSASSYLLPRLRFNKLLCIREIVSYNFHFPTSHRTHVILYQERLERLESNGEILAHGIAFQSAWLPVSNSDPLQACRESQSNHCSAELCGRERTDPEGNTCASARPFGSRL